MGRISRGINIHAPLDVCWELNADATRLTEWNPSILEVRDVTGRLDKVGTTYTGVISAMGRRFPGRNVVTRVEPNRLVETEGTGVAGAKARLLVTFEARGDVTRVIVTIDYDLPGGIFGGIAEKLFATKQLEDQLKASNQGFKALAEREAAKAAAPPSA
jgi:uncharacterized membrane protein